MHSQKVILDIYIEVLPDQFEFAIEQLKTLNFIEKQNTLRTNELCMLDSLNNDDVASSSCSNRFNIHIFLNL